MLNLRMPTAVFAVFLVSSLIIGCNSPHRIPSKLPVFELKTSPCFGECPVFQLQVYHNGVATFKGESFTEKEGTWINKFEKSKITDFAEKLRNIHFFKLNDVYDNPGVSDLASTYITFRDGKNEKTINCRFDVPDNLLEAIKELGNWRGHEGWKKWENKDD